MGQERFQQEPLLWSPVTAAAIADGALQGLPVVQAISHIDPLVLKAAIESSSADHVHNFVSIHKMLQDHLFSTSGGWFERLTGYVMEQKTASALEAAGHHVIFAATANNPGWDILVDGHPVQIKEGLAGVKQFLAEHHNIPIFTGAENAAAMKDPMVHGIAGLNSDAIHATTAGSIGDIHDAFDPTFHFPFITIAISSYRQLNFFQEDRIRLSTAAARVAMDGIGVFAGGFAGAKAGAIAGSFLGPPGTAAGGFLGALAGAIGGKMVSAGVQNAPFKQAKLAYERVIDSAKREVDVALDKSQIAVRELQSDYQDRFIQARSRVAQSAEAKTREIAIDYESKFMIFAERFPAYLRELSSLLESERIAVLGTVPTSGFLRRKIMPTRGDHLSSAINLWFEHAQTLIEASREEFIALQPRTPETLRAAIEEFLNDYVFELDSLNHDITAVSSELERAKHRAERVQSNAQQELEQQRSALIKRLSIDVERIHENVVKIIQSWNEQIDQRLTALRREGRAIGVDL
jgi:hypothetical protein